MIILFFDSKLHVYIFNKDFLIITICYFLYFRPSRSTSPSVAVYEIASVTRADEGTYQCTARNSAGMSFFLYTMYTTRSMIYEETFILKLNAEDCKSQILNIIGAFSYISNMIKL